MTTPNIVFIVNGHETEMIDFGVVPVDTIKVLTVIVLNKAMPTLYDAEFYIDDKDVKIMKSPKKLEQSKHEEVVLEYHPTLETESGLRAELKVKGKYLA